MERLTKRNNRGVAYMAIADTLPKKDQEIEGSKPTLKGLYAMFQKLAEYEDLAEQGRLHIAPIKNGTEIFYPFKDLLSDEDIEEEVIESTYVYGLTEWEWGEMNKDWFLTREEAEKVLEAEK